MRSLLNYLMILSVFFGTASCSKVAFESAEGNPSANGTGCTGATCPNGSNYSWYQGGFTATCSKPCGGGTQTQTVECHDNNGVTVADSLCTGTKPNSTQTCNLNACTGTYTWNSGPWSATCSLTCGGGVKTRSVLCQDQSGQTVSDSNCAGTPKPDTTQPCNTDPCPTYTYSWSVTPGTCSVPCGGGSQTDTVVCKRSDGTVVADSMCTGTKPTATHSCNPTACPPNYTYIWEAQPYGTCSATCGTGIQTRAVACKRSDGTYVADGFCPTATKPATQQNCNTQSCPTNHHVHQTLYVTPAQNSVDVVLIVDDSSSMADDQAKLAQRLIGLISDLDALKIDYQVCLTTTDVGYYKGAPIKWVGLNSVIMNGASPNKNQVFIDTVNSLGAQWSSDERAIDAVNLMIRDFQPSGCFRPLATLTALVISDEDERSVGGIQSESPQQYQPLEAMDTPDNLIANVHSTFDNASTGFVKPFIWNSIIDKPGDTQCRTIQDSQGSPSFWGNLYADLSNKTGGYIGSICDSDYTQNLAFMKDRVVNSMPGMTLQCTPIGNPSVTFDQAIQTTISLMGNQLKFAPVIPEGVTISADYTCPN